MRDWLTLVKEAEAVGFRLEIVNKVPVWETSPVLRHQRAVDLIRASVRPAAFGEEAHGCVNYASLAIRFPDGSHKRPDIAIFCREPDEQDTEVTLLPEAVIEILSKEYEAKDLEIGVPFYRNMNIKDIIVLDPETGVVRHWQQGEAQERELQSPVAITLLCGCAVTV